MALCWITGQICYNGIRAVRNGESNPCLEEFWVSLCFGPLDTPHESKDRVIGKQWSELDISLQRRRNQVSEEITWVDEDADTCEEVSMIMIGEPEEMDDDRGNLNYRTEQSRKVREV